MAGIGDWIPRLQNGARASAPGAAITLAGCLGSYAVADASGLPVVFCAVLAGLATQLPAQKNFQASEGLSRLVLQLGVALVGIRLDASQVMDIGVSAVAPAVAVSATVLFAGFAIGRLLGLEKGAAAISACATAICGISAAMAMAIMLPPGPRRDVWLAQTVAAVIVVGTLVMAAMPLLARMAHLEGVEAGVFVGAAVHDVAQAAAGGYTLGEDAGAAAVATKLIRVALLGLAVPLAGAVLLGNGGAQIRWTPPWFIFAFLAFSVLRSSMELPAGVVALLSDASQWLLVAALVALGGRISLRALLRGGWRLPLAMALQALLAILVALIATRLAFLS